LVQDRVLEVFNIDITEGKIWRSIRSKHISGMASQFLWKVMHDIYMIGHRWLQESMLEEYHDRAICVVCGNVESIDHILFRCEAVGQAEVWGELRKVWENMGVPWKDPDWGTALGTGCVVIKTDKGIRRRPIKALWTILWSETVHLIWKLHCERVIRKNGEEFTFQEVKNAWHATIERRLTLDRRTAVLAKGKTDLKQGDVECIWAPIVENYRDLPKGWVGNSRVLVDIKSGQG
ncbi:hypothetical protein BD309DRAFT_878765, partial [Dichomitus squalens]